jgi:hypothetical protein
LSPREIAQSKTKDVNFCPFCGESFDQKGVKFCPNCGSNV